MAGLRFGWSGIELRLESAWEPVFELPGSFLFVNLGVALTSAQ